MSNIKREQFKKREKNCSLDIYITEPDGNIQQTDMGNIKDMMESAPGSNPKSLTGVSRNSIHGIKSLPALHDKDPYMPPKCFLSLKRKMPSVSIKIKVSKPANKCPTSNPQSPPTTATTNGSRNFLSVPSPDLIINAATPILEQDDESYSSIQESSFHSHALPNINIETVNKNPIPRTSIALVVPKTLFIPSVAQMSRSSCRSMEHLTPNRSLEGSFAVQPRVSMEHLS